MKKLVFLIGGLNFGGMERVVFIAAKLLRKYYNVTIVTMYQTNADYTVDEKLYDMNVPPNYSKIGKIIAFIRRLLQTIKMKRQLKPDIVFSFGMYANYLNILSKKNEITVSSIRSYDWMTQPFLSKKLDRMIMQKFDKMSSVSELIRIDAEKFWGIASDSNITIYNPYNIEAIQQNAYTEIDDYKFSDDLFYFFTMGRLADQKGFNHLIRAFRELVNLDEQVHLIIMGDGYRKKALQNMIREYELEKYIDLLPSHSNAVSFVKKASCYVLSSITEGFPNALVEAMCVQTPVVAVNCKSGPAEILFREAQIARRIDTYCIGDYGIISSELAFDPDYNKKKINKDEENLAIAMHYAVTHRDVIKNIAMSATEHMKVFTEGKFLDKLLKILDE